MNPLSLLKVNLKYTPFVNIDITVKLDVVLASIGERYVFDDT